MHTRNILLAGVASIALIGATAALAAEDAPSNAELFRMLKQQQEMIKTQQDEIKKLRGELHQTKTIQAKTQQDMAAQRQDLSRTKQDLVVTRKSVDDSKQMVKAEVDKARTELGTAPSNTVFKVYDPPGGRFSAMAELIYMRPSSNMQTYGAFNATNQQDLAVDASYDPGFRLGFGYHFGGGLDARIIYTFLRASSSDTQTRPAGQNFFVGYYDNVNPNSGKATYKLGYDVVDFEAGLNIGVGSSVVLRGFGGLRFASLRERLTFNGLDGNGPVSVDARSDFWGIGPRLGLMGSVDIGWGLSLFGHMAGSIPVGTSKRSTRALDFNSDNSTRSPNQVTINPQIDASIGFAYTYQMSQMSALTFKAGYRFEYWLNNRPAPGFTGEGLSNDNPGLGIDGFFFSASYRW